MKKTITTTVLALVTLISTSAFIASYQTGIAGFTGAPGEASCNSCHSGASSAASSINISSVPAFTTNEFIPGTTYVITVDVAASNFSKFGFGCEILDDQLVNTGTMQNAGPGVKFLFSGGRKNAVHTTPKSGTGTASFSFEWVAPTVGDTATIYVAGNAVNGNGSTSGDFPLATELLQLQAQPPVLEPVGISKNKSNILAQVSVYPNPASNLATLSYVLTQSQQVSVQLIDIYGKTVKELVQDKQAPGPHSHLLDLQGIAPGIYFVKLSGNNTKLSQKMITVL